MISNRPEAGRTFQSAMWVIGVVAALQLFGVVWAMMKRPALGTDRGNYTSAPQEFQMIPPEPPAFPPMPLNPAAGGQQTANQPSQPRGGAPAPPAVAATAPQAQPSRSMGANLGSVGVGNRAPVGDVGNGGVRSGEVGESEFSERELIEPGQPALAQPRFVGPAEAAPVTPGSLTESLTQASISATEIQDLIVERLVTAGVELRSSDNMQGALQALKEAEAALPNHPRIMSELAATYRQMGLDEKADNYWEKVESLGELGAGSYYGIARQQLRGEAIPAPGAVNRNMKIGEVIVEEMPAEDASQKVAANIVIETGDDANVDAERVSVLVFFYDQVDGDDIKPSTADTSYHFVTKDEQWLIDGKGKITVEYSQPIFTEEQARELGERKYFGYVIQLYYQDELQDRVVRPPELEPYHLDAPLSDPQEPRGLEPENALFPD